MNWNLMSDYEQVYLWWDYCADNEEISFQEFDEMMREAFGDES